MDWKWSKANEKDIARFVNEKAIELLKLSIDDRQKLLENKCGRRKLVKAIYQELCEKGIRYYFEKYQPETEIQLIRNPSEIISISQEGTCLDLALLFCSLCFGYDLLPLIIILEGHALAAVSLNHHRRNGWNAYGPERELFINESTLFQGPENLSKLQKLIEEEAYIAVECTGFAHTESLGNTKTPEITERINGVLPFEQAVEAGLNLLNDPSRPFKFAIDIAIAQYDWKIEPYDFPSFSNPRSKPPTVNVNEIIKNQKGGETISIDANGKDLKDGMELNVTSNIDEISEGKHTGVKL